MLHFQIQNHVDVVHINKWISLATLIAIGYIICSGEQFHNSVVDVMHITVLGCQDGSMLDVLRVPKLGLVPNRVHVFDEVL